ncbi:hypothetical protein SELMODRAFT_446685 [Selaginella moellendorffii]|uniref:Bifunctional inhibitor/plant lipid transfer protein/seed storage helical domain-containing protein n=1 Tax=Selaginella moellendorffii TaxID=88036 RepID=D8STI7_SELML|nr:uncharacterized protein LOC9660402 [Selaginella moellendorffii]EFJ12210.1 hypothetical protein SELMODRAFT_446685 [Selaginella moellendorffii]|eukprot:XP_002986647.1 uncharacterized protein LOC9660402 [Selaginella moellendorffii]
MAKAVVAMAMLVLVLACYAEAACSNNYIQLAGCLNAVSSSAGYPGSSCCTAVSHFKNDVNCLCSTLVAAKNAGVIRNMPNALTVPKRCGFKNNIPKNFRCAGYKVGS